MSFTKVVYWKPSRVDEILDPEALQISDAAFLATHQPLKMYRQRDISDASTRSPYDEQTFLKDFLKPQNYAFVPVLGDAGTGKSHLIKWLSVNIPETPNRRVLLIRKLGTNLRDVILQILSIKGADGPRFKEYRARVQNATNALTEGMARELLLDHLAAVIGPHGPHRMQGLSEEEQYLAARLPNLLHDPYFRRHLLADGGVVHGLVTHSIGAGSAQRRTERQAFKAKDLPEGLQDYERAGKDAQEIYIALANHPQLRDSAVTWLNRHLDEAIRQVFSLGGQDLFNLMIEVRKALASQSKPVELVILIEDFAKLQGIDMQLLEALLVRPHQEQYGELCALRVALACTSGYFQPLLDTVQQRADFYVNLDVALESGLLRDDDAEALVARYLNAVRLDEAQLKRWYDRAKEDAPEDRDAVPNACTGCEQRELCHAAFGEHDGFGLYPFNRAMIAEGLRRVSGDHFNPRLLLRDVVKHVLQNYTKDLQEGRFPPPALHQHFGGTYRQSMGPLLRQEIRQLDPTNHQRRAILLDLWSNTDTVIDLHEGVHEAFSLPQLRRGQARPSGATPTSQAPPATPGLARPAAAPAAAPSPPQPTPHVGAEPQELLRFIQNVNDWSEKKHKFTQPEVNALRSLIFNTVCAQINWDAELLLSSALTGTGNAFANPSINFPGGMVGAEGKQPVYLPIPLEDESRVDVAVALIGLLRHNHHGHWGFDDGARYLRAYARQAQKWSNVVLRQIRHPVREATSFDPIPAAVELLAVGQILSGHPQVVSDDVQSRVDALFRTEEPTDLGARSNAWRKLSNLFTLRREGQPSVRDRIIEILKSRVACAKGGGRDVQVIDVSRILEPLHSIWSGWALRCELPTGLESSREFKVLADFRGKVDELFAVAIEEERRRYDEWVTRAIDALGEEPDLAKTFEHLEQAAQSAGEAGLLVGASATQLAEMIREFPKQDFVREFRAIVALSKETDITSTVARLSVNRAPLMTATDQLLETADRFLTQSIDRARGQLQHNSEGADTLEVALREIRQYMTAISEMLGDLKGGSR